MNSSELPLTCMSSPSSQGDNSIRLTSALSQSPMACVQASSHQSACPFGCTSAVREADLYAGGQAAVSALMSKPVADLHMAEPHLSHEWRAEACTAVLEAWHSESPIEASSYHSQHTVLVWQEQLTKTCWVSPRRRLLRLAGDTHEWRWYGSCWPAQHGRRQIRLMQVYETDQQTGKR